MEVYKALLTILSLLLVVFAAPGRLITAVAVDNNTIPNATTLNTASVLAPSFVSGQCSFHATIREECRTSWKQTGDLYGSINMPRVWDSAHNELQLSWPVGLGWQDFRGESEIHGMDKKFTLADWYFFDGIGGQMKFSYGDCHWNEDEAPAPGRCGSCGKGDWTRGKPDCPHSVAWNTRYHDIDCWFEC